PPYHPYTRLLIASVPELSQGWLERTLEMRETQASIDRAVEITDRGCPFYRRCPLAIAGTCNQEEPPLHNLGHGHSIACHRSEAEL
ncbi:MAG: ABC transporter, partial [Proteobacteria bacterium]|nr:ABC transporter [Pseudomonadota bacterium]